MHVVREASPMEEAFYVRQWDTARLALEPPSLSDALEVYRSWASDPDVTRYLLWPPHTSLEVTVISQAQLASSWLEDDPNRAWMVRTHGGQLLGMLAGEAYEHRLQLGYFLARRAWGNGYMTELMGAASQRALDAGFSRVEAVVHVDNTSSARVLEKVGFEREGRLRRYHVFPTVSEEPADVWMYARCR